MIATYGDNCIDRYTGPAAADFVGGNAVNVAVHLADLGAEVGYVGIVGDDTNGAKVKQALRERGVDCSRLVIRKGPTGLTWIDVRNGERIILEESLGVQCPMSLEREQLEWLAHAELIHCTAFAPWNVAWREACPSIVEETEFLYRAGVPVSLDFSESDEPELAKLLGRFLLAVFASRGPGCPADRLARTFSFFHSCGVPEVVVTLGQDGSAYSDGSSVIHVPAKPIAAVDTLGAGDAFIAGWLFGWVRGEKPENRLQRASDLAAAACLYFGAWPLVTPASTGSRRRGSNDAGSTNPET